MTGQIRKVAVLGSGVMGSAIAAHVANAGIPCLVLDIVPRELLPEEKEKGLTLESPEVRNRIATAAMDGAVGRRPAPFFTPEGRALVETGNFDDDFARIGECDWIVEVVLERMDVKKQVHARIAEHRKPGAIVTTNTSGLSLAGMTEDCPEEYRQHFVGTHFFNPVRYMKLLEIIPGPDTLPEVVEFMAEFGERRLGKGIVHCKDTPNFIANRVGVFYMMRTVHLQQETGYTIEEVDAITGPALAHPRTGIFRLCDLVGIDTLNDVCDNVHNAARDDEQRGTFTVPDFLRAMPEKGLRGDKSGAGFYKKTKSEDGKRLILSYDIAAGEHRAPQKPAIDSLDATRKIEDAGARVKHMVESDDRGGKFAWTLTRDLLAYAAHRMGEIADSVLDVDRAMCWGFNWELGPFERWDAIGVADSVARMKAEGVAIPAWVDEMLASGKGSFYVDRDGERYAYNPATREYEKERLHPRVVLLPTLKERSKTVATNGSANLIDLGDGVACLEFQTKMNSIDNGIIEMLERAVEEVEKNFEGLVIGHHHPRAFSVGANLKLIADAAAQQNWEPLDRLSRDFQRADMKLKTCQKPVVVAPAGLALGGGAEIVLHGTRVQAHAELYMGLVEASVGLIPAAGGVKEMAVRATEGLPSGGPVPVDPMPYIAHNFQTVAMALTAGSAEHAGQLGFLRATDGVTMNRDHLIQDAKDQVLHMARMVFVAQQPRTDVLVGGTATKEALVDSVKARQAAGKASEYDVHMAATIAHVLTGGDVPAGSRVSEQHLLDVEREAFMSVVGEPKTQERIAHMLKTGKPLRN